MEEYQQGEHFVVIYCTNSSVKQLVKLKFQSNALTALPESVRGVTGRVDNLSSRMKRKKERMKGSVPIVPLESVLGAMERTSKHSRIMVRTV